jgi:hypothetical protein
VRVFNAGDNDVPFFGSTVRPQGSVASPLRAPARIRYLSTIFATILEDEVSLSLRRQRGRT